MLMIFPWAKLSGKLRSSWAHSPLSEKLLDHIGRRPIILTGALGVTATSLFLGISGSFAQIVALRVVGTDLSTSLTLFNNISTKLVFSPEIMLCIKLS
jgi:MFS family permease